MTISELYENKLLSSRLYNICEGNGLITFECIKEHYKTHQTFGNLKKCGKKSNNELIGVYLTLRHSIDQYKQGENDKCLLVSLSELDPASIIYLNKFIRFSFYQLSNRTQKTLAAYLEWNIDLETFQKKILTRSFSISNLQNAGKKTIKEINFYIEKVIDFIVLLSSNKKEDLNEAIENYLYKNVFPFSVLPKNVSQYRSIFPVVNYLLDKQLLFNKIENMVFEKTCKLYMSENQVDFEKLAGELGISSERVRHLRRVTLEKLNNQLLFINLITDDYLNDLIHPTTREMISIDKAMHQQINRINNTDFSLGFIAILLSVYLSDYYVFKDKGDSNNFSKILSLSLGEERIEYQLFRRE